MRQPNTTPIAPPARPWAVVAHAVQTCAQSQRTLMYTQPPIEPACEIALEVS